MLEQDHGVVAGYMDFAFLHGCCHGTVVTVVVEHPRLGPSGASALRAQFDCNLTAIWFKFDVGGEETEAPEVPRLQ
jgi:hypothetical protein